MESLTRMTIIGGCSNLKLFPEEVLLHASLISLQVGELPKLEMLNLRGFQFLTSLKGLRINSCSKLLSFTVCQKGSCPSHFSEWLSERCQQSQGED
ncbi:hypothetical protein Ddye_031710 [Dipteronia dyeriana]|uniref:CC-NBS-LRR protein n=1 Tax=Dipteronia dyeriana TaxID=168575 RepID=A0AAD9WNX5_9ROSI|nr:hypothetical protein Ddye_031710 [Dipteronia dyeriana]